MLNTPTAKEVFCLVSNKFRTSITADFFRHSKGRKNLAYGLAKTFCSCRSISNFDLDDFWSNGQLIHNDQVMVTCQLKEIATDHFKWYFRK